MADNTNDTQFITMPAGVLKAATMFTSKEKARVTLQAVHIEGKLRGDKLSVTVAATDSYKLFVAEYELEKGLFSGIGEDGIGWTIKPNGKLGTCNAVRIEARDTYGEYEVTSYKLAARSSKLDPLAFAAAKADAAAYDIWKAVDGRYPDIKQLIPERKNLVAVAGFCAAPTIMADVFKALKEATGTESATFEGMSRKGVPEQKRTKFGGPVMFSSDNGKVHAKAIVMPQASDNLVVGASCATMEDFIDKAAYDDMCALFRNQVDRADKLEKELAALKEQVPDAEYELDLRKRFQERNLELVEKVEQLEADIAALKEQKPEEVTAIVKAERPAPTIEDDGVFLTIDTSMVEGYIVRSKDGSPLALATQNGTNAWLQGDMKALGDAIKGTFPDVKWSSKRRAFWAKIA